MTRSVPIFAVVRNAMARFGRDETGAIGIYSMFTFLAMSCVCAVALDVTHVYSARTQMQVAADFAAHAALYNRETMSADDAKQTAVDLVATSMPDTIYGSLFTSDDIGFGTYDYESSTFNPDPDAIEAVQVVLERHEDNANPIASFLSQLLGIDAWSVRVTATYTTFNPMCFREGFVADGVVDIQSNNAFTNGFCIHSNEYVSLNSNNTFEPGTVVSMPNLNDLDLPQSGFKTNDGLQASLRSGAYRMRVLNRIDTLITGVQTFGSSLMPNYITSATVVNLSGRSFTQSQFISGHIHRLTCSGGKLTIANGSVLRRVVVVTNCEVKFGSGTVLEDVVFVTTNTGANSFNSPSGLRLGRNDSCAVGGGAQLVTRGGVNIASGLQMYGGQILALGTVEFAANANGLEGASIVAGGEISGTSNMDMGFCGGGMEDNFESNYFRLAL